MEAGNRGKRGSANGHWKGGKALTGRISGYRRIQLSGFYGHPRADKKGRVYEHLIVAEKALGRPIPLGVEVHHVDGNATNNHTPFNLVICENHKYHMLLHYRAKAYAACGNPSHMQCEYCKAWDAPERVTIVDNKRSGIYAKHRQCHTDYERVRRTAQV